MTVGERSGRSRLEVWTLAVSIGMGPVAVAACSSGSGAPCRDNPVIVYAQNDFPPAGAAIKDKPAIGAETVGIAEGNAPLELIGWKKTPNLVYPDNPPGAQGDAWAEIRYQDDDAYVSTAALRLKKTHYDKEGRDDTLEAPADSKFLRDDPALRVCEEK